MVNELLRMNLDDATLKVNLKRIQGYLILDNFKIYLQGLPLCHPLSLASLTAGKIASAENFLRIKLN